MHEVTSSRDERARVRKALAGHVLEFCQRLGVGSEFHAPELTAWVVWRQRTVPESPARILRLLRQERVIDYQCLSRRNSLYRITALPSVQS